MEEESVVEATDPVEEVVETEEVVEVEEGITMEEAHEIVTEAEADEEVPGPSYKERREARRA